MFFILLCSLSYCITSVSATEQAVRRGLHKLDGTTTTRSIPSSGNAQPWPTSSSISSVNELPMHDKTNTKTYAALTQADLAEAASTSDPHNQVLLEESQRDTLLKRHGTVLKPLTDYMLLSQTSTVYYPDYMTDTEFVPVVATSTETDISYVPTTLTQFSTTTSTETDTYTSTLTTSSTVVQPTTISVVSTKTSFSVISGTIFSYTITSVSTSVSSITSTTTIRSTLTTTATSTTTSTLIPQLLRSTVVLFKTTYPAISESGLTVIRNTIQTQFTPFVSMLNGGRKKSVSGSLKLTPTRATQTLDLNKERQSGASISYFSTLTTTSTSTIFNGPTTVVQPFYTSTIDIFVTSPTDASKLCVSNTPNLYSTSGGLYDVHNPLLVNLVGFNGTGAPACCERCLKDNASNCAGMVYYPAQNNGTGNCVLLLLKNAATCNQQAITMLYNTAHDPVTASTNAVATMALGFCGSFVQAT